MTAENPFASPEVLSGLITGFTTLLGAVIVGVFGALIGARYSRERDRQDRESQWRSHAIELTKLDLDRKLKTRSADEREPLRPSILDFLANYRDLQELGGATPAELYARIRESRVSARDGARPEVENEKPNNAAAGDVDEGR